MYKPKILVTSAAGKTGVPTTLQLLDYGFPVRAFVRSYDHRAKRLEEAGAEIFVGDMYSMVDMRKAMTGVQRTYHCSPTQTNMLHFGAVFAIAAQEANLEHIVMLTQWTAEANHPSVVTRETWMNEQLLRSLPNTSLTVINVGWFAENYFMGSLEAAAQLGIWMMPLGDGDEKKNAPPSNDDIAAVVVAALIDPAAHADNTYRPTGPELLSPNEMAAIMSNVLGRKVKYLDAPDWMVMKALISQGFPATMVAQLVIYAEEYRRGTFAINAPNNVVRDLTSQGAEDFETITRRVVASRPEAVRTFGHWLKAMGNFMKVPFASGTDPKAIARRAEHVVLESPTFDRDSHDWIESHDPATGYVPNRPVTQVG
ncbi:MAG: NmrA family NAD(P)-binding protein [Motiliproteus sp.]